MQRPPRRYWRALTGEVWRLVGVTAAVLTAIVAFSAGVRPLAEGRLEPADALRFMGLALIPMLQFTAPFAAGFAATLSHHRLVSENEDLALEAAGVPRRTILAPAALTGLAMALIVAALAHLAIPHVLRSMQALVTRDAARVLIGAVERGEAAHFGGFAIHADRAIRGEPDRARGITDRLFLFGVVAYEETPDGEIRAEVAAERAEVLLTSERRPGEERPATVVRMLLRGAVGRRQGEALGEVGSVTIGPWVVPDAFEDSPRLHTFGELRELARRPQMHPAVDVRRRALARALALREVADRVVAGIESEGRAVFGDGRGGRLTVWAGGAEARDGAIELTPGPGGISLERAGADATETLTARAGRITPDAGDPAEGVRATLELIGVQRPGGAPPSQRVEIPGLTLADDPLPGLMSRSTGALIERARERLARDPDDAALEAALADLQWRVRRLHREILGNDQQRWALAAACVFIALLSAAVALRRRQGGALQVYLWSFFPALAAVVTISGGENAVPDNPAVGLAVLWGGVATLAGLSLIEARRLSGPMIP